MNKSNQEYLQQKNKRAEFIARMRIGVDEVPRKPYLCGFYILPVIGYVFTLETGYRLIVKLFPAFMQMYFNVMFLTLLTLILILLLLAVTKQIGMIKSRPLETPLMSAFNETDFRNGDVFLWTYQEQGKNLVIEYYSPIPSKRWNEQAQIIAEGLAVEIIEPIRRRKISKKAMGVIVLLAKKKTSEKKFNFYDMKSDESTKSILLGYNILTEKPILADLHTTGHTCIIGGTGSGKSVATLTFLYSLLKNYEAKKLFIGDFKRSGDYIGLSDNFAEFDAVTGLIEAFYAEFEETPENNQQIKLLLIDEYAGYIVWLTQTDKKKADYIKGIISNLLMLGRSRLCFVWCVQQRMTASLFPTGIGAIDNFQICVGFGRLSVESRKSLFAGEHLANTSFEESYHPKTGQGLILIDGQELQPIQIPHISDKERLKAELQELAKESRCR